MNSDVWRVVVLLLVSVVSLPAVLQAEHPDVDLLVVRDGWGDIQRATVQKVLESTASELWRYFPDRKLPPIIVKPKGGPIVLFKRGPEDEYFLHLDTGETYWSQYAYQFGHEFCHILCNYDADDTGNDWFEESICEMASLFVLRRMGETWKTNPPFDHWKNFAPKLTNYADRIIKQNSIDDSTTLAQWYGDHRGDLHGSSTKRELNNIVAVALLPLFEKSPEHWISVMWLNNGQPKEPQRLKAYLADWRQNCPEKNRPFVDEVAALFGITLER